ncbi:peptidoglycan DD-metalloendopeptidase family protein [Phenylobacterium sp. LjRoot225]|uniref:peptidoglycan DD-metalloendopeptidase family protein n=1 Tax=Phenylobacterium sp. LjRoot225 TaxID=3342285 RepID=UPI003ECF0318
MLAGAGVVLALALGWKAAEQVLGPAARAPTSQTAPLAVQSRPAAPAPEKVPVRVLPGETLAEAVERAGVAPDEARRAVQTLGEAMDTVNIKAGMAFEAAVARPAAERGHAQLISLSLQASPVRALTLSRTFDGALTLRQRDEAVREDTVAADGEIEGSLYETAEKLGATPTITAQVVKLFAHKLDFQRDIQPGDDFKLVFDRTVTESGKTIEVGDLQYAELHGVKFYRFERPHGDAEYFDQSGKNIKGFLLRTPVDGARVTSAFGMRRHPVLGYTRAHQGIDFGAGQGAPILAAGDGVVVEAGRKGGYGNWLRIRHAGVWDTGYGHISRFAPGMRPGVRVRQGQVVAYVGATGLATGPHLHYEIFRRGQRVNPLSAKVPQGTVLAGRELKRFKAEKARIDGLLAAQEKPQTLALAEVGQALRR